MVNPVITEWLADGRLMRILNDVSFLDSSGKLWIAKSGTIINGASIPRFFWRVIGSPYVGKYRRSAVIHDAYYDSQDEPRKKVDQMFYECMIVDGVSKIKSFLMFKAVRIFASYKKKAG